MLILEDTTPASLRLAAGVRLYGGLKSLKNIKMVDRVIVQLIKEINYRTIS